MVRCDPLPIIVLICIAGLFTGFTYSGVLNPNILDLSPRHAGKFFGICNTVSNFSGFIAPQVTGKLIDGNENTVRGWYGVWIVCGIVSVIGGIFYALVASADEQQWSKQKMSVKEQLSYERTQFCDHFKRKTSLNKTMPE